MFIAGTLLIPQFTFAFSDLSQVHTNAEAIEYVRTQGIVSGYSDGTYKPDVQINRAEFTKIIVEATQTSISGSRCFPDVNTEWFAEYVCTAKNVGIVGGYPDGRFQPANPISFVEAAKIISNAFAISSGASSSVWYEPFVLALEGRKAIPLEVQRLDHPITRGQMAEMIYRLHANRTDKPSQTYAHLPQVTAIQSEGDRVLVTLPLPFTRYSFYTDPALKVDRAGQYHLLILPVETNINDNRERSVKLFVNGEAKGDFKGIAFADFVGDSSKPIYVTSDGKKQTATGLPKFKQINKETVERIIQRMKSPDFLDEARAAWSRYVSEEELDQEMEKVRAGLPEQIEQTKMQLEEQLRQPAKDIIEFLEGEDSISAIMRNNTPGEYLVVISPGFAQAKVMLFKNGALASNHKVPLYFHIAENEGKTKFLYRGQTIGSLDKSEIMVVDNGVESKKYAWTTQPQYNATDEVMYMALTTLPESKEDYAKIGCKAVTGKSEKDVRCNDQLFFTLINHPFFRFPVSSSDGKTTVYAELVEAGTYENDDFEDGIESPPKSRLVVNGKARTTHPYIDKPFFTSKGLAVSSYAEKPGTQIAQYVEWNGKKSAEFQAIGTGLVETLGFRGVSPLYAAISSLVRGDLGVEEIDPEIIVSSDGNSIAFAGYKSQEGWTVMKDMASIGTYKLVDQLTYSLDGKHLAFMAVTGDFEPLLNQSFWLGEDAGQSSDAVSSVIVDGKEIGKHEKMLWLQYAPNGVLTYIGRDQKQYTLYIDGRPVGAAFDRILMPPRFNNGIIEVGGARGEKIVLMKQSLVTSQTTVSRTPGKTPSPARESVVSQESIVLTEIIKNTIPSRLKPLAVGSQKSTTFYTDEKDIYELSLMEESKNKKIHNLYRLEGETPDNFKVLNEYYAVGKKAYSHAGRIASHSFSTGKVTYGEPTVKVISNDTSKFIAVGRHATDGTQAFYLSERISADAASFQPLNTYFAKDKFGVFYNGNTFAESDHTTFVAINDACGSDSKNTYCYDQRQTVFKLPLMDGSTLKYMHDGFAYDKNKAVCQEHTFDLDTKNLRVMTYGYGDELLLDKKRVYKFRYTCPPELIEGMDPNTLEEVMVDGKPSKVWLKDAKHVFYALKIFPDADPNTFRVLLDHEFSLDANHVFWRNEIIAGADPKTFELITDRYAKDAKNVYLWNKIVPGVDPRSFSPPQ